MMVRALARVRDLPSVTTAVGLATRDITGADGVTVVLREGAHCYYADEDAIAPLWKGRRFPLADCISGWVIANDEPVAVPDIYADPRIPPDAYRSTFVKSLLMVPVRNPEPIAAIGVYWAARHEPSRAECESLEMVAEMASLALSNAYAYRDLQESLGAERVARTVAESAVSAKDNFLAILSHELRQPLAAATSAVHLLRSRAGAAINARATDILDRQVTRMVRLVDDLLDASRIVRGEVELKRERVDLRKILHNAVETASTTIVERNHVLRLSLPGDDCWVDGDSSRLEQVIVNLLLNATKYTPPGGRIDVGLERDDARACVRVRDNGIGIESSCIDEIFELFRRSATNEQHGLGVGLAVARQLAVRHGGTLRVSSDGTGQGSEFVLELPALQTAECAEA